MKHCPPCLRKWPLALFLLAAEVLFFLINVHMPLMIDDYWYNYMIGADENGKISHLATRISSWQDLLTTLYHHYFIMNGRFSSVLAHVVQFIGGKFLFDILNTGVFLAFVLLTSKFGLRQVSLAATSSVMIVFILLIYNPQGTMLWLSGACNYLWGALALAAFLSIIRASLEGQSVGRLRLLFGMAAGVLCGCIHEGLGAPLVAALVLYGLNLLLQGKGLPRPYIWLTIAVAVGLLLPISSPALWNRAEDTGSPFSIQGLISKSSSLLYRTWLPSLLAAAMTWRQRRSLRQSFFPFLVLPNFALAFAFGDSGLWGGGYFYYCLSVMLWVLDFLRDWIKRHSLIVAIASIPISLGILTCELFLAHSINGTYQQALEAAKTERIVSLDYFSSDHSVPWILSASLPLAKDGFKYPYVGRLAGQHDFYVIINTYVQDKSIYASFDNEQEDVPIAKRIGDQCIIRLPRNFFVGVHDAPIEMEDATQLPCNMRLNNMFSIERKLFQDLMRMPRSGYGRDYHEGFHYLIIPPPACEYERVRFKMMREDDDKKQEVVLPLPKKEE